MLFKPPYTFLTTKPRIRLLSRDHPEWLAILPISHVISYTLKAIVTFTDDEIESHDLIIVPGHNRNTLTLGSVVGTIQVDDILTAGDVTGTVTAIDGSQYTVSITGDNFSTGAVSSSSGGTSNIHNVTVDADIALQAGEVQCFDMSFATQAYDALNPAKTIRSILIRIESPDFADQDAQDHIIYYPYTPKGDNIRAIYYHNSYGGIDSIICTGDQQHSIETTGYITHRPLDLGYDLGAAQIKYADPYHQTISQVSTGPKPGLEVFALHDLFALKAAYEHRQISGVDVLVPIIPEGQGIAFPSAKTNIKNLAFSYRYAFEERAKDRQGT